MRISDEFLSNLEKVSGASRETILESFTQPGRQCLLPNKNKASGRGEQ